MTPGLAKRGVLNSMRLIRFSGQLKPRNLFCGVGMPAGRVGLTQKVIKEKCLEINREASTSQEPLCSI